MDYNPHLHRQLNPDSVLQGQLQEFGGGGGGGEGN